MGSKSRTQQTQILNRLRRIEGQIRGLQRIVLEERSCDEFVQQLSAAKGALEQVALMAVANRMARSLGVDIAAESPQAPEVEEAMRLLLKLG